MLVRGPGNVKEATHRQPVSGRWSHSARIHFRTGQPFWNAGLRLLPPRARRGLWRTRIRLLPPGHSQRPACGHSPECALTPPRSSASSTTRQPARYVATVRFGPVLALQDTDPN